jgi:23S rRNA pseudouridine1911/1915/1917 synthase
MSNTLHATADVTGERLDVFLARTLPMYSRSFWQAQCNNGHVQSDGNQRKSSYQVNESEQFDITLPEQPNFSRHAIPILYEDDDVLVLNKPAGLLTHAKGVLSSEFSVAEFVRPRTTADAQTNRPGIVHRLDRGTSGVIITAKTSEAKNWLQKQFSQRKVKKTYIALLHGHLKQQTATLDLPIQRNPQKPQTFRVDANGKPAQTQFETLQVFPHHTLVQFRPATGRTHQLRVHAAYLGHAIVGDPLYGKVEKTLPRLFLHAKSLELTLPNRQRKTFEAPLPPELTKFLQTIQS